MISTRQIIRLLESENYGQLIRRVLANGRGGDAATAIVLTHSSVAAAAALGLGIQRLIELTYVPGPVINVLARRLLRLQRHDGFFGRKSAPLEDSLIASTSVAIGGVFKLADQASGAGLSIDRIFSNAIDRGLAALADSFHHDATMRHARGWAALLWQLGDRPELRSHLDVNELLNAVEHASNDSQENTLIRMAHAMAA